jgi:hypothetical protein
MLQPKNAISVVVGDFIAINAFIRQPDDVIVVDVRTSRREIVIVPHAIKRVRNSAHGSHRFLVHPT